MTGSARALCYRLAVASGLRYAEIASIKPASLVLDGPHPTVTILAAYAKQGILVLDTFNTFTDASGRSNYFSREFFHR